MDDLRVRDLGRARQQVFRQSGCLWLAVCAVDHFLEQGGTYTLGQPAKDLAIDNHGVDQHSTILGNHVIK